VCRDRSRFRARGSHEVRPGRKCAARRVADAQLYSGCAGLLRSHASSLRRLRFFVRFALPTHTVDPPTTSSPSSTTLSHAPPFALADSPPPLPSTALPNPPKQALHPPHTSLIQPPAVAASSIQRTHPRFARVAGHHQARFWSSQLTDEPK
jgi:hypothetical protein